MHHPLKVACLPIPPRAHVMIGGSKVVKKSTISNSPLLEFALFCEPLFTTFKVHFEHVQKQNQHIVIGALFIIVGATWLFANFDLLPSTLRSYLFHWENILIGSGLFLWMATGEKRKGILLLVLGLILGADYLFNLDFSIIDLWPLLLVFIGATLIKRAKLKFSAGHSYEKESISDFAVFGGGDRVYDSQSFQYGQLTAIFGGSNIDLTTAKLHESGAQLDVLYLFGGSKIRVPHDWQISIKATALFGGLSDKRLVQTSNDQAPQRTLIIKGLVIFGGAEIVN